MNVFFEDDGQLQGRRRFSPTTTPRCRSRPLHGKRSQGQGRQRAAALRRARGDGVAGRGAARWRRRSTSISCGRSAATTNSASPSSRPSISATRRRRWRAPPCALRAGRGADVLLQARQGALPQGAARGAEGGAGVGGAQAARGRAAWRAGWRSSPRGGCPRRSRARLPMLLYKPDKNTLEWKALAAACDAQQTNPVALLAACGAIPSTHDYHFNALPGARFPQGHRPFPPGATCRRRPICRSRRCAPSRSTTPRPPRSTTRSRCTELRRRRAGASASTSPRPALAIAPGSPLDAIARDAPVHRLHAGTQDHHAARGGDRRLHAGGGRRPCRPCRCTWT